MRSEYMDEHQALHVDELYVVQCKIVHLTQWIKEKLNLKYHIFPNHTTKNSNYFKNINYKKMPLN